MSDSLRDRIVAALAKADQDWCSDRPLHEDQADAVIAALNEARYNWARPEDWMDDEGRC